MMVGNGLLKSIVLGTNMLTALKVLGVVWLISFLLLGVVYLWGKFIGQPFCEDYDGDDM